MKRKVFLLVLAATIAAASVTLSSARVAPANSLLDALPDGAGVALVDFQKVSGSALWTTIASQAKLKGAIDKAQSEMTDLGIRLSDIRTVAIVFPAAGRNNPTVALTGGFEREDLLRRLRASDKVSLTSEKYKDFEIFSAKTKDASVPSKDKVSSKPDSAKTATIAAKDETSFVFYEASTIVAGSMDGVRASVDVKTGGRPGISQNAKLTDALAQNSTAAIRFALAITPAMTSGLQSSELPIPDFSSVTMIFGSIDVASGIDLNATLRSDNAEHARAISERLNGLVTMAKGFVSLVSDPKIAGIAEALKTVSIVSADADVKITASVPMELLNSLLSSSTKKGQ